MTVDPKKLTQTAADAQRRAAEARARAAAEEATREARNKAYDAARLAEIRAGQRDLTSAGLSYKVERALEQAASAGSTSASLEVHRTGAGDDYYSQGWHTGALDAAKAEAARLNAIPGVTAEVSETAEQVTKKYLSSGIGESGTSGATQRSYETTENVVTINVRVRRP